MSGNLKLNTALGGSIALTPTNTASNITVTIPATTGTLLTTATAGVPVNGPAFSAYQSTSQPALSAGTDTKILFQTEEYDTNSNFASSRFTPTVSGYYQVCANVQVLTAQSSVTVSVFKNGTKYKTGLEPAGSIIYGSGVSAQVFLNGSTDYIEIYANFGVSQATQAFSNSTWFQAAMIRSAT
jgi:hypothetical protein